MSDYTKNIVDLLNFYMIENRLPTFDKVFIQVKIEEDSNTQFNNLFSLS